MMPTTPPRRAVPERPSRGRPRSHVNLAETARRLANQRELWARLVDFDPLTRYYARIASEPGFEAWLLTWLPGQGTGWHDHGDSSGSFVVLQGRLTELVATSVGPGRPHVIADTATVVEPGKQRTFGRTYVHRVTNHGSDPAVSLHVYAPKLTVMTTYEDQGSIVLPIDVQREGSDW